MATKTETRFNWSDPFLLEQQLSEEERMVRDTARAYCKDRLAPRVLEAFRHERTEERVGRVDGLHFDQRLVRAIRQPRHGAAPSHADVITHGAAIRNDGLLP